VLERVVPVAAAIALACCALASVGEAAGATTTVPGAAGVKQYVETLPSAGGGVPSGSATTSTHGSRIRVTARSAGGGGIGSAGLLAILIGGIAATTGAGLLLRRRWIAGASRAHADG
jgi:hypothetical protein